MDELIQFLGMGGYGGYVWPAFGVVLFVMVSLWITSIRAWRKSEETLMTLREGRRRSEGFEK